MHPAFWLVLAVWLALIATSARCCPAWPACWFRPVLAAGSIAAIVGGARGRGRPAGQAGRNQLRGPGDRPLGGAHGANDDDSSITCIAVDDGERSWSFDVSGEAFAQLALGDTVTVRASPRSGKLLGLTPDQDRAGGATLLGQAGMAAAMRAARAPAGACPQPPRPVSP